MKSVRLLHHPLVEAAMPRVESRLLDELACGDDRINRLTLHLVHAGGKRLRPALAIACSLRSGTTEVSERLVRIASALELLHVGSLHHDDVIDHATTRRGIPSVNAEYGDPAAVLSGDLLFSRASLIMSEMGEEQSRAVSETVDAMCRGQMLELFDLRNPRRTVDAYYASIDGKTAALIATATRLGAIEGGFDRDEVEAIAVYGREVGRMFQIADDVLDVVGDDAAAGKPVGNDLREGVYTLPVLLARNRSPRLQRRLARRMGRRAVRAARTEIIDANGIEHALARVAAHARAANDALAAVHHLESGAVEVLRAFAQDHVRAVMQAAQGAVRDSASSAARFADGFEAATAPAPV